MARRFTDEQEREICRQYLAGKSNRAIGATFGLAHSSVRKLLARNGVKERSKTQASAIGSPLTGEQKEQIVERYLNGDGGTVLGAAFGVTPRTIRMTLRAAGITCRSLGEAQLSRHRVLTAKQEKELCARYLEGESAAALAVPFGISKSAVGALLLRHDIPRHVFFTEEQEQAICSAYLRGETSIDLGEQFGTTAAVICRCLERNGIDRRRDAGGGFCDTIKNVLAGTDRFAGEYGAEVLRLVFATRAKAYFLEQAVLDATRGYRDCPDDLAGWGGASEVRAMPAEDMVPIVLRLAEELEAMGAWAFAAGYVPMTAAQRLTCQQRAMELAHAESL